MEHLHLNPHLLNVPLYVAGKPIEEVQEEYGLTEVIKLASNENPLGMSALARAAFERALNEAHRYPAVGDRNLRRKLAGLYNTRHNATFTQDNFLTGNGIGDVLRMITESFIFDGGETVICSATFPLYRILTTQFGGKLVAVPHKNYYHDLPAMLDAITSDTRLVILCNPNNPTGTLISRDHVNEFMARVPPHVVVVFDESYYEIVEDPNYSNAIEFIHQGRDQVILLRGFSKVHGLASLRIGYALGTHAMIEYLHHAQLTFNTGDPVFYAAMAALDDQAHIDAVRQLIATEKHYLYEGLSELDLSFIPTAANFLLLVDLPRATKYIYEELLKRGVIVRVATGFGLPDAIRVSIGTHRENEKFLHALKDTLRSANGK
ncbi:MAG: Histidinol-phosphate aminotransferase [Anaerolineae bacterium]|nr:Histidinol-phosphate aminotransferase [Anaerolineae bacterium]